MNRFDRFSASTWSFLVICTLAFGLSGCEGDDGAPGADGADGALGPQGPQGDEGPPGPGASITPLESCAVCHSEGSYVSAPASHEVFDVGAFADFAVNPVAGTTDLLVSFSATLDGGPAVGATFYRSYCWDGADRTTLTNDIDPVTDFVDNGDGTFELTIPDGETSCLTTNPTARFLVILQAGMNDLEIAAVGDYPDPIPLAGLANPDACVGCHGASGEGNGLDGRFNPLFRGGHYSAPMSVNACVVCHNLRGGGIETAPGYGQIAQVIHGVHNSHEGEGNDFLDDFDVSYPTYMTNCSVCHSDETIVPAVGVSALDAANAMPVTGAGCFTCHGSMAGWDFTGLEFHLNIVDPETADCAQCHDGALAPATVAAFHNGLTTERGGIIWDGDDTSVTEGAKFDWVITGIVDDGVNMAISWQATYDADGDGPGAPVGVDPCNATVGVGAPAFHAIPPLPPLTPDDPPRNRANLSMLRNYFQGDDPILGQSPSAPGQALSVNVTTDNTACAGGIATTTIPVDDVDAERGIVALQGKPWVVSADATTEGGAMQVRAVTPTYEWMLGSGDAPLMTRRSIVDTTECLKCHVGSLYQHGGNRVDNVDMCVLCHNSASNEQSVRVGLGVDPSEAYDGQVGETFEMKTMLHRIHSSGVEGQPPYVIYRNRGIYAFAPDTSELPNWPGTGPQIVYGSDGDRVINHNFHSADYPRALNACTACHDEDFSVLPDQADAMATTVDAGSTVWEDQVDDVLQGATTTACVTCHAGSATTGHAYQNSWQPQVFPEGRETIIDAAQ